jgi:two-component system response regulator WspF
LKIGIANGSSKIAAALQQVMALVPGYDIAWIAGNGREAVEFCAKILPDIVLMDMDMPVMDGVEATRRIMADTPCTILIAAVNVEASPSRVFEAMGLGAFDAANIPTIESGDKSINAASLLAKMEAVIKLMRTGPRLHNKPARRTPYRSTSPQQLIAIGSSAGGPTALATLLTALPKMFAASIVIVQHVDARFAPGMAKWLNGHSALPVRLAEEGDCPTPGTVLLAGTDDHLTFKEANRLGYTSEPRAAVYRPSVDVFFQSICTLWPGKVTGVLLTGMGRDGAIGLKALRAKGCYTIAQDEATCAVYGMPKAAAQLAAAVHILPLPQIAAKLIELVTHSDSERAQHGYQRTT